MEDKLSEIKDNEAGIKNLDSDIVETQANIVAKGSVTKEFGVPHSEEISNTLKKQSNQIDYYFMLAN